MTADRKSRLAGAGALGAAGLVAAGAAYARLVRPRTDRWGATDEEVDRAMPGDEIVQGADYVATRAVTIFATPEEVWPWIVQMGSGRAGWYAYDGIDNGAVPSADHIIPEFQRADVGDLVPMSVDDAVGVYVKSLEPNRSMLWWDGKGDYTWAWGLYPAGTRATRLVTRLRVHTVPWRTGLGKRAYALLASTGDIVMMRKCLRGIKARAEGTTRTGRKAPDALLDRYMPVADVDERHETQIEAPADVTWDVARHLDFGQSRLVRAIFRGRELMMRSTSPEPEATPDEEGASAAPGDAGDFLSRALALGWRMLAEEPGREILLGAVTKPWEADPEFLGLAPDAFIAFDEPGYVKIAWMLRVDEIGEAVSLFSTETRAIATNRESRRRFRRYWRLVLPGVLVIRHEMLRLVKHEAERRSTV